MFQSTQKDAESVPLVCFSILSLIVLIASDTIQIDDVGLRASAIPKRSVPDSNIKSSNPTKKICTESTIRAIARGIKGQRKPYPDPSAHKIESELVAPQLSTFGYIHLVCHDSAMIRGDTMVFLLFHYQGFAIELTRADKTGYFMVFQKSLTGDADLANCYECIRDELNRKRMLDKNIIDVDMVPKQVDGESETFGDL